MASTQATESLSLSIPGRVVIDRFSDLVDCCLRYLPANERVVSIPVPTRAVLDDLSISAFERYRGADLSRAQDPRLALEARIGFLVHGVNLRRFIMGELREMTRVSWARDADDVFRRRDARYGYLRAALAREIDDFEHVLRALLCRVRHGDLAEEVMELFNAQWWLRAGVESDRWYGPVEGVDISRVPMCVGRM